MKMSFLYLNDNCYDLGSIKIKISHFANIWDTRLRAPVEMEILNGLDLDSSSQQSLECTNYNASMSSTCKALLNDMILLNILKFLDVEDSKSFRLVCCKWRAVSETSFRQTTRIMFTFRKSVNISIGQMSLQENEKCHMREMFYHTVFEGEVAFGELWLVNMTESEDVMKLSNMLMEKPDFIKCIKILDFFLIDERIRLPKIDVTPLLQGQCLTKLDFQNCIVPLNQLLSLETVILNNCIVTVMKGVKIAPKMLDLSSVEFRETSKTSEGSNILVNDIIEFRRLEILRLYCWNKQKNISLDVQGNCKLLKVDLTHVDILNGNLCEWEVEKLILTSTQFPLSKYGKIRQLNISEQDVDISVLPISLQSLTLSQLAVNEEARLRQPNLPNLKHLFVNVSHVSVLRVDLSFLSRYFYAFLNLYSIELNWHLYGAAVLDLNKLSKTIKKVKITFSSNKPIQIKGDRIHLDELILFASYHLPNQTIVWNNIEKFLKRVSARHLALEFGSLISETIWKLLQKSFAKLTVGTLKWNEGYVAYDPFKSSPIVNLVDKKSKYYIFEKGYGRCINKTIFDKICELGC